LAEQNSGYEAARMQELALRDSAKRARNEDESRSADSELHQAKYAKQQYEVVRNHFQKQIDEIGDKRGLLSPSDGVVLGAPKPDDVGKEFLREDPTPFCSIGDPNRLIVLVPVSPHDYQVLSSDLKEMKELAVSIRIPGRGSDYVPGRVVRLPESDAKDVPLPLAQSGGGPLAIKPGTDQQKQRMPQSQQYLVTVEITQPDDAVCPGTLVQAKIHCRWRTSAWWVWHAIASAFDLGLL
jgi:putative peptide zinc metalloprotease protein